MVQSSILKKLSDLGQSVWYDNISRELIQNGGLGNIVASGVTGLTSNPSIFEKSISSSSIYDGDIESLALKGLEDEEIFETLAISDIQAAADLLKGVYHATSGSDGFVSLEVNPHLATDTNGTIEEARKLFNAVDRFKLNPMFNVIIIVNNSDENIFIDSRTRKVLKNVKNYDENFLITMRYY